MKRAIAMALCLCLLLAGCGTAKKPAETTATHDVSLQDLIDGTANQPAADPAAAPAEAAEETTEEVTEAPTEPQLLFNPLNGSPLEAPFDGRVVACTISNIRDAIPHVSVNQADILMEMYVNGSIDRCLALYTDFEAVESAGSVRSTRLMFSDIAQHLGAILVHGNGSDVAKEDVQKRGVQSVDIDTWEVLKTGAGFRDKDREKHIGLEHSLMANGPLVLELAESKGYQLKNNEAKDYLLRFTEDGTPADGEDAKKIDITLVYGQSRKDTTMLYNDELQKYVFNQYGKQMEDGVTGEPEAFRNVIVMYTSIHMNGPYHEADFTDGGTGYFACGGKIIPITWTCNGDNEPFAFQTEDGRTLELGQGNTYIAVCISDSPVVWSAE